jgi:hypothetical protein
VTPARPLHPGERLEWLRHQKTSAPQKENPDMTTATIHLDTPIVRDGQTIERIELRKPAAGELRGIVLLALLQMDVDAIASLLPRISTPMVTKPEALAMDPADLLAVGVEVAGFLQQKAASTGYQPG